MNHFFFFKSNLEPTLSLPMSDVNMYIGVNLLQWNNWLKSSKKKIRMFSLCRNLDVLIEKKSVGVVVQILFSFVLGYGNL